MGKHNHKVYTADEIQNGRRLSVRYRPNTERAGEGIAEVFDVATGERIANVFAIHLDGGVSKPQQVLISLYLGEPKGVASINAEVVLNANQRDSVAQEYYAKWDESRFPLALSSKTSWKDFGITGDSRNGQAGAKTNADKDAEAQG